jgi:hypothetical protein
MPLGMLTMDICRHVESKPQGRAFLQIFLNEFFWETWHLRKGSEALAPIVQGGRQG